jgi:hypothetical protein
MPAMKRMLQTARLPSMEIKDISLKDEGPSLEELPRNEVDLSDLYDEYGEIPF